MQKFLISLRRNLPKLLLSLILAFAVWISSVTEADPTEEKLYPQPVPIEFIGQDPALIGVNDIPDQISLTLSAPQSIWNRLLNEQVPIRAVVDLSGLPAGQHILPVQIQVGIRPVEVVTFSPANITVELEPLASREMNIQLVQQGETAVGYQAETPQMDEKMVVVSGPETLVNKVQEIRALINYNRTAENIDRVINLQAYDASGGVVEGITLTPDKVNVTVPVTQRGGYRNVVVKVVLNGQISTGYRVTNISVFPPAVTVFSSDPQLVSNLPGYVETLPLDLTGARDDLDLRLSLSLPSGVLVVGEQTVAVQVGIAALEGSLTLNSMDVEIVGLEEGLKAEISPSEVDVYLSGPIPVLDALNKQNVRVILDLAGLAPGTYQRVPDVQAGGPEVVGESIIPGSVEVIITGTAKKGLIPTNTPTPRPTMTISPGS
jgi:YbbR domain-containing protein